MSSGRERFKVETTIQQGVTAELFRAFDVDKHQDVMVWVTRYALELHEQVSFSQHLEIMRSFEFGISEAGLDEHERGFIILPRIDGGPLVVPGLDTAEAERRFLLILRFVKRIHEQGVVLGDLTSGTFWLTRTGEVRLVGIVGRHGAIDDAPLAVSRYVAPEEAVTTRSDVYALGVIAAEVFELDERSPDFLHTLTQPGVPGWVSSVLPRLLSVTVSARPANAEEVLSIINVAKDEQTQKASAPVKKAQSSLVDRPQQERSSGPAPSYDQSSSDGQAEKKHSFIRNLCMIIGVLSLVAVVFLIVRTPPQREISPYEKVATGELRRAMSAISQGDASFEDQQQQVKTIIASDDPLAHGFLVQVFRESQVPELKTLALDGIVARGKRFKLTTLSETIRLWLRVALNEEQPVWFFGVLDLLDRTIAREQMVETVKKIMVDFPYFGQRLAAALFLDKVDNGDLLISALGDTFKGRHPLALILGIDELSSMLSDAQKKEVIGVPSGDIEWLFPRLARRGDPVIALLATKLKGQGEGAGPTQRLLGIISERTDINPLVVQSLAQAIGGVVSERDIEALGNWQDEEGTDALLALLCKELPPELQLLTFDSVIGRSVLPEPQLALARWIRNKVWSRRQEFAQLFGVLRYVEGVPPIQRDREVQRLGEFAKDNELVGLLVRKSSAAVLQSVLPVVGQGVTTGMLLRLLKHPEPAGRVLAIRNLASTNDAAASKIIIDYYRQDEDPVVRAEYEKTFWFIRERMK